MLHQFEKQKNDYTTEREEFEEERENFGDMLSRANQHIEHSSSQVQSLEQEREQLIAALRNQSIVYPAQNPSSVQTTTVPNPSTDISFSSTVSEPIVLTSQHKYSVPSKTPKPILRKTIDVQQSERRK